MTYVMIGVLVLAIAGVVMWAVSRSDPHSDDPREAVDHTQRTDDRVTPPVHPDAPIPGSATARARDHDVGSPPPDPTSGPRTA